MLGLHPKVPFRVQKGPRASGRVILVLAQEVGVNKKAHSNVLCLHKKWVVIIAFCSVIREALLFNKECRQQCSQRCIGAVKTVGATTHCVSAVRAIWGNNSRMGVLTNGKGCLHTVWWHFLYIPGCPLAMLQRRGAIIIILSITPRALQASQNPTTDSNNPSEK